MNISFDLLRMKHKPLYKVPDIIDFIYDDVMKGFYFNTLHPGKKNRVKLTKCNIACDYLMNTDIEIESIVEDLDFPDIETFTQIFKSYMGIEPKEFRKRFGQKK